MKIFISCPVRNATEEQINSIKNYKLKLQSAGHSVYYPSDDNPYEHTDNIGYQICEENTKALRESDEVHIFWDAASSGSLFGLGSALALNKPLKIINPEALKITPTKSFSNMILEWSLKQH